MAKPELEFFNTEAIPWKPIKNSPGQYEKILSSDPKTGFQNRTLKNSFQVKGYLQEELCVMKICGKKYLL